MEIYEKNATKLSKEKLNRKEHDGALRGCP